MNETIVNQIIILFLIMLVGIYASKKNILTEETTQSLSKFMINIALPFLILSSFNYEVSKELIDNCLKIFLYATIIHVFLILFSKLLCIKHDQNTSIVLRASYIFSNAGFIGYPLMAGLYGKVGILYTAIFGIPYNIILFTFGSLLFSKKSIKYNTLETIKTILFNPGILATILGIILMLFNLKLPECIYTAVDSIGSMTTPLAMLIIGSMLSSINLNEIFTDTSMYIFSFYKLILIPTAVYILLVLCKAPDQLRTICVILEATPTAVVCSVFAEHYNINPKLATKFIFITTLLSLITMPLLMSVL